MLQDVTLRNPDVQIQVDASRSVSIFVSRAQSTPRPFVLEVHADTRSAGLHFLGAIAVDADTVSDPLVRPGIVVASAWVPGALGYHVRLVQVEPAVPGVADDIVLNVEMDSGPPGAVPGLVLHRDATLRLLPIAPGPGPFQLASRGPRKLASVSAFLALNGATGPLFLLFFDASDTDPATAAATASPYEPLPLVDGALVGLGADQIDTSPVLRFRRGLRALVSSTPFVYTPPVGGPPNVRVDGYSRA